MIGRDAVEVLARRVTILYPLGLVPTAPQNPLSFWRLGNTLSHTLQRFCQRGQVVVVNALHRQRDGREMQMRVAEAGDDGAPFEVNRFDVGADERLQVFVHACHDDAPVTNHNRLRARAFGIHGVDVAVVEDGVEFHRDSKANFDCIISSVST